MAEERTAYVVAGFFVVVNFIIFLKVRNPLGFKLSVQRERTYLEAPGAPGNRLRMAVQIM